MQSATETLNGVRILVVEDDPASARLLLVLLVQQGADVRVAQNAEEANAILKTYAAQMIVADLILPKMSGLLLVKQLKANEATRDIPVIAVSVVDGAETERLALQSGCAAYIRKPIDIETFTTVVVAHLKGSK